MSLLEKPYGARYDVFAYRIHTGAHPARIAYGAWAQARPGCASGTAAGPGDG